MINQITNFHKHLQKGECMKIAMTNDYSTYVSKNDDIVTYDNLVVIRKANGAKLAINTSQIILVKVVEEWMVKP